VTNHITLRRTALSNGESDFYPNVVSYVVRAQDVRPDATVRATASDVGIILQNETPSEGGGDQGVNTVVSLPCIQIGVDCLPGVGANGAILFSGSVTNCGNNTLVGVGITNFVNGQAIQVAFVNQLEQGEVATFNGSWMPLDPCSPSMARLEAHGTDQFTVNPRTVTASASTTCQNALTPGIRVTLACPVGPVSPGQTLLFTGTVTNTGNVTLNNMVVTGDHPANTTVFTVATLAPGTGIAFTGSYTAPVDCSTATALVARATSVCGTAVTDNAAVTCTLLTRPAILVSILCSPTTAAPGGVQIYTGTVRNTGDIPLNNVTVVSDRPASSTTVFSVGTLAPGASADFTGTYTVPLVNACAITTTVVATGRDACTSAVVNSTASATCGVTTTPGLALTLNCPVSPSMTGARITFTGTVSNNGNVTLTNVTVMNAQASPATVLTLATLAPGASANFTASFIAPTDSCDVSTTVNASGRDDCSGLVVNATRSVNCTLLTSPSLVVTQDCPVQPVSAGGLFTYTGTVRNTGNVILTNVVVSDDRRGLRTTGVASIWFDDQFPAGAVESTGDGAWSFVNSNPAPFSGNRAYQSDIKAGSHQHFFTSATSTLTVNTGDILTTHVFLDPANMPRQVLLQWNHGTWDHRAYWGENLIGFSGDGSDRKRYMGPLPAAGQWVRLDVPAVLVGLENRVVSGMAFSLFDGRATFDAIGKLSGASDPTQVFTVARLVPGETAAFSGSYQLTGSEAWEVTTRLIARGFDTCSGVGASATILSTCPLVTEPAIEVTQSCPATPGVQGGLLNYSGTVRNIGNVTLRNVVVRNNRTGSNPVLTLASLAPGQSANFTGSYIVPVNCCTVSSTATATGADNCTGEVVSDTGSSTCPVMTSPALEITKTCPLLPVGPGDLLTYTGTVRNTGNVTLINVRVSARASTACPILTTPRLTVVETCPTSPVPVGGLHTFGGSLTNLGDVNLTNVMVFSTRSGGERVVVLGPVELAPGESARFTGSYVVTSGSNPAFDIIEASGMDTCLGRTVIARANCAGPIGPAAEPIMRTVSVLNGVATVTWDSVPGETYTLQCKGNHEDPIWINIPGNVTATGTTVTKTDQVGPSPKRFYRAIIAE
jgi:uncharacterized repeat protein (TIGR01451 family)